MASRSIQLLLLLLTTSYAQLSAQLIKPNGDVISNESGYPFSMGVAFKLFGQDIAASATNFLTRATGRIVIGASESQQYSIYDPLKMPPYNLIQPLEFVSVPNIPSLINVRTLRQHQVTGDELVNMSAIVKENFWNMDGFTATAGYLFTWEEQAAPSDSTKVNTFQAALLTNGDSTFAIYNYVHFDFTVNPINVGELMSGFARSNSLDTQTLPFRGSEQPRLVTVSGVSSQRAGMFVYRIDSWPPVRGGCISQDPATEADRALSSTVVRESLLGGSVAVVSGACHSGGLGERGTCTVTVDGRTVGQAPATSCPTCGRVFLLCQMPAVLREGRGQLSMAVTGSANAYTGEVMFASPDEALGPRITLTEPDEWNKVLPDNLRITFDPSLLNGTGTLEIVGYSEQGLSDLDSVESRQSLIKVLHSMNISSEVAGQLNLRSPAIHCSVKEDCESYHVGYLRIVDQAQPMAMLRSNIIPLGWFVNNHYTTAGMPTWFTTKCSEWSAMNSEATNQARQQLQQLTCPCNEHLALGDVSRYIPASRCSLISASCTEAMPKQNCYVSRVPAGSDIEAAAASVCCYNAENHELLHQELRDGTNPKLHGSTSYRSHPDGVSSSAALKAGQAAHMSHWYWDNLKHMYCCAWSNTGTCPFYYMRWRPTPKCSTYQLGRSSFAVGDPHITSFGLKKFLFNNFGEYWLVKSDSFKVQGRFEASRVDGKYSNFTLLTATSFSVGTGAIFEVKFANARPAVTRRVGSAKQQAVTLSQGSIYRDSGVTLVLKSDTNLIAQLSSASDSIGIDLRGIASSASLHLSLSTGMKDKTSGLYGRWTDTEANEFTAADGTAVAFNSDPQQWDNLFCNRSRVLSESESLFNYDKARNLGFREINVDSLTSYLPTFDYTSLPQHSRESECADNENCKFDLRVSGDITLALDTKSTDEAFTAMQVSDNTTLNYCDKPAIVGVSISQTESMMEGSSMTISCVAPLAISRAGLSVTCQRQSDNTFSWTPNPDVTCLLNGEAATVNSANVGLIIGIVAGVLVLLVVVIVVVVLVMRARSEPSGGRGEKYMEEAAPMRPAASQGQARPTHIQGGQGQRPGSMQRPGPGPAPGQVQGGEFGSGGRPRPGSQRSYDNTQQPPTHQAADPRSDSYQQSRDQPMDPTELGYRGNTPSPRPQQQQPPVYAGGHSEVV